MELSVPAVAALHGQFLPAHPISRLLSLTSAEPSALPLRLGRPAAGRRGGSGVESRSRLSLVPRSRDRAAADAPTTAPALASYAGE